MGNQGTKVSRPSTCGHRTRKEDFNVEISSNHGHTGEHLLRPTAKYMKIEMTGQLSPCEICAQAKIRQANIPKKKQEQVPSRPGYRIFMDISSFKHESMGGKRHWLLLLMSLVTAATAFSLRGK